MKILFLAYTKDFGLGHYYRTLALAQEASARGHFTVFLSDRPAMVPGVYTKKVKTWNDYDFMATLIIVQPDWVVADLPNPEPPGWLWTNYPVYKLCLIDGNPKFCNLAIGQGLGGLDYEAPEYIIIPPELKVIRRVVHPNKCWFVWGGTGDVQKMLPAFSRSVDETAVLVGVQGLTPPPTFLRSVVHMYKQANDRQEFFKIAADCNKAAVQMGQTIWELLYLGIPCWVFSHSERNLATALELDRRGWVKAFRKVGLPGKTGMKRFLASDFELKDRPVDGNGASRIIELLEQR